MCGFGIGTIFQVAIFVIVVLVVLALLSRSPGRLLRHITSAPYWNIIQIVIGGVVAILILLFLWRLAECAGSVWACWSARWDWPEETMNLPRVKTFKAKVTTPDAC